jgi:hypothetical protein
MALVVRMVLIVLVMRLFREKLGRLDSNPAPQNSIDFLFSPA